MWRLKILYLFLFLLQSNSSLAIKTFDNTREAKITNMVQCLNHEQNLDLYSTLEYELTDFNTTLNIALTLQAIDDIGSIEKHCALNTINNLSDTLISLDIKKEFQVISKKINKIYPKIFLDTLLKNTFFCKSNKRLERLVGVGILASKHRRLAWRPGKNGSRDGIFYKSYPLPTNQKEKDKVTWSFIKELLHHYVDMDRGFYDRDADIQQVIQLFQKHFQNDLLNVNSIKTEALQFGFPYYK